jgi:hypothetical protein
MKNRGSPARTVPRTVSHGAGDEHDGTFGPISTNSASSARTHTSTTPPYNIASFVQPIAWISSSDRVVTAREPSPRYHLAQVEFQFVQLVQRRFQRPCHYRHRSRQTRRRSNGQP